MGGDDRALVERLHRLVEIGIALSAEQNLDRLLERILTEARRLTSADAGSIWLRQDERVRTPNPTAADPLYTETPWLVLKIAQNDSVEFPFRAVRIPFDTHSVAGYAAVTGRIVNAPDVYALPPGTPFEVSKSFDEATGYRTRSMVVVPMRNREGQSIGVLQLINRKRDVRARIRSAQDAAAHVVPFDDVDEELLAALGSQAGVAVEKARLYDEVARLFDGFVESLIVVLERRNRTTHGHCMRVARYAEEIARAIHECPDPPFTDIRFTEEQIREIRYAALLHDIGKLSVPEAVLDKRNKLTDAQIEAIAWRFAAAGRPPEEIEFIRKVNVPPPISAEDLARLEEMARQTVRGPDGQERPLLTAREREQIESLRGLHIRATTEDDVLRLKELARQTVRGPDGRDHPLLTPEELENLSIRRGNLTAAERREIEKHIVHTWEILARIDWPKSLRRVPHIAATHHEKLDGRGYPWGFRGEQLDVVQRILPIVDIFEALTAKDRPYKPPLPVPMALAVLEQDVRAGRLDADIFRLFVARGIHKIFADETGVVRPKEAT